MKQTVDETRYTRGLVKLTELGAQADEEIAEMGDLGRYIVEFGFGDIYSRGGLSLRERRWPRSRCSRPWAVASRKSGSTWARP